MITLGQTTFLIDILKSVPEIAEVYDIECDDTFNKFEKMSEGKRSAIHYHLGRKRFVRVKLILNKLGIKPNGKIQ